MGRSEGQCLSPERVSLSSFAWLLLGNSNLEIRAEIARSMKPTSYVGFVRKTKAVDQWRSGYYWKPLSLNQPLLFVC